MSLDNGPDSGDEYEALMQFLYLVPVGLVQTTLDGTIVMINPVSAQLLMPLSRDGNLTNLFTALENVAPALRHVCADFRPSQGVVCDAMYIPLSAGTPRTPAAMVVSLTIVKLDETRLMSVLSDVSVQVQRERELKQSGVWLNAILTNITDYAMVSLDWCGRIEAWNESIGRMMGYAPDTLIGQPYSVFCLPGTTTPDHLRDSLREADDNGWSLDEGIRLRADGSQFWGSSMISPLQDRGEPSGADGEGAALTPAYCLIIRDISDKREANERQRIATFCDYLTGLANRRAFFEAAELEVARWKQAPRPTAMIMIDADHFKTVNDQFGHPAGDAVLRHLAAALSATFRAVDVVARVGGEEFAVLLPSTDLAGAAALAERLRKLVETAPARVDGVAISYTISAGVAAMDASLNAMDGLMKRADLALYAAKAGGRNRVECWSADYPPFKGRQLGGTHAA